MSTLEALFDCSVVEAWIRVQGATWWLANRRSGLLATEMRPNVGGRRRTGKTKTRPGATMASVVAWIRWQASRMIDMDALFSSGGEDV